METHQVRYFLAVARTLNFTKAAQDCNVTQPSLTRAIKKLEDELGGALFHRERANTHLTELGRMVRPHFDAVYQQSRAVKRLSQDFAASKIPLRLGIMCTISPIEIVDLIAAVKARYPDIELKLFDANAWQLRERLLAGDLDLVIYALPGEEPDDRLHSIALFREQMVIAVHRGHRLANERVFPVRQLDGEYYIHRVNCEFAGYADEILRAQGVTCTPTYWSERDDWTLAMVAAGLGFGFMPANAASYPGVAALPVIEPEFWRDVKLVSVRGRPHSPAVGALVREAMRKSWVGKRAMAASSAA